MMAGSISQYMDRTYAVGDFTLTLTFSLKGEGISELRKSFMETRFSFQVDQERQIAERFVV